VAATDTSFLLFVPSPQGYRIEEREGEAPQLGDAVELGGGRFVVNRVGPSPYPGDDRRCAFLLTRP
jgi:hypothetical protein